MQFYRDEIRCFFAMKLQRSRFFIDLSKIAIGTARGVFFNGSPNFILYWLGPDSLQGFKKIIIIIVMILVITVIIIITIFE